MNAENDNTSGRPNTSKPRCYQDVHAQAGVHLETTRPAMIARKDWIARFPIPPTRFPIPPTDSLPNVPEAPCGL
jgi:hypothetical protein